MCIWTLVEGGSSRRKLGKDGLGICMHACMNGLKERGPKHRVKRGLKADYTWARGCRVNERDWAVSIVKPLNTVHRIVHVFEISLHPFAGIGLLIQKH